MADAPDGPDSGQPRGVARQSLGLLSANVAGNAGFFLSALIIARSLGPSGRGTIAFFIVSTLIGSKIVGLGLADATVVIAARHPAHRSAVLSQALYLSAGTGLLGGAMAVGVLGMASAWRPHGIDGVILVLIGLGIFASTVSSSTNGFLRGCGRFTAYSGLIALAPWLYALCLGVLWFDHGLDIRRVAVVWVVYAGCAAIASLVLAVRVAGLSKPEPRLARESMAFGIRAWVGSLAGTLNSRIDQVIMGFITTEAVLGLYSVSVNVSETLLYLPNATAAVLLPAVLQSAPEHRVTQTLAVFRRLNVVTVAGAVVAGAVGAPLITVVFGQAYHDSVVPFLILLPGGLGYSALAVAEAGLYAVEAPQLASLATAVTLVVGIVLDFVLVPPFGADGASAAASAALLAGGAAGIALFRKSSSFRWKDTIPGRGDIVAIVSSARSAIGALAAMRVS